MIFCFLVLIISCFVLQPFLAMVHRMRKMRSSYIVQLLGVCLLPPVYIALEYSPCGDLATYLKRHRTIVSPAQLLQAMLSVISALQYLIPAAQVSTSLLTVIWNQRITVIACMHVHTCTGDFLTVH